MQRDIAHAVNLLFHPSSIAIIGASETTMYDGLVKSKQVTFIQKR